MTTSSDYWIFVPYEYIEEQTEERFLFVFKRINHTKKYTEQLNYDGWYLLCDKCGEDASEWMKGEGKILLAPVNAYVMSKISAKALEWEEAFLDEFTECLYCGKPIPELKHDIRVYQKLGDKKWSAEAEAKRREAEAKRREWETKRREAEAEAYKERLRQETIQSLEERARQGDLIAYHEWKKLVGDKMKQ